VLASDVTATLPLAIDIGATRVRIAHAEWEDRELKIRRVAVRELPEGASTSGAIAEGAFVAAVIEDARAELAVRERRCICAIGMPDASLHAMVFPKMTALERERAARFELVRYTQFPIDGAVVRIQNVNAERGIYAVGAAKASAVASRVATIRQAGLRPVAMDHESAALARALRGYDSIVDIGLQRSSVHAYTSGGVPHTIALSSGGRLVTQSIARELAIDETSAESRKRIIGSAGAGEAQRHLASEIALAIASARRRGAVRNTALVGNGARTKGLAEAIEAAADVRVTIPVAEALRGGAFGDDVLRAAAADWNLVTGLALWGGAT